MDNILPFWRKIGKICKSRISQFRSVFWWGGTPAQPERSGTTENNVQKCVSSFKTLSRELSETDTGERNVSLEAHPWSDIAHVVWWFHILGLYRYNAWAMGPPLTEKHKFWTLSFSARCLWVTPYVPSPKNWTKLWNSRFCIFASIFRQTVKIWVQF